jgi:hypothetical protein
MTSARKPEGKKGEEGGVVVRRGGESGTVPQAKCADCGGPRDGRHLRCKSCRRTAAQSAIATVDDFTHRRYHEAQADPLIDTAAKRLARAADVDYVKCGCGERFPSAIIPA